MVKSILKWEDIKEGDEIPILKETPTYMQLFMYSAITWNRHLIHYNTDFAHHDGLNNVVTHRALLGSFLAKMLSNWVGEAGRVSKVEWSVRGSAFPGDTITCRGKVIQKRIEAKTKLVECEIWIENPKGETIAPGKGKVALFD